MTALRKDAMELLEQVPEDKLYFIIQIMQKNKNNQNRIEKQTIKGVEVLLYDK